MKIRKWLWATINLNQCCLPAFYTATYKGQTRGYFKQVEVMHDWNCHHPSLVVHEYGDPRIGDLWEKYNRPYKDQGTVKVPEEEIPTDLKGKGYFRRVVG